MRIFSTPVLASSLLLLAACGENGPLVPAESTAANEGAASDGRSYVTGYFAMTLDGSDCGLIQKVEGGDIEGEVVHEAPSAAYLTKKHIGNVKYNEITVQIPIKSSACTSWVSDLLGGKPTRKSGRIVSYDAALSQKSVREFANALITEVGFPALDGASKDAAYLTLKFAPEVVRFKKGDGSKLVSSKEDRSFVASSFAIQIPGLDTKAVSKIDAITVKQTVAKSEVGEARDYLKEPGKLEFPNLKVTFTESAAESWAAWHQSFVIDGKNDDSQEKTGSIVFLDPTRSKTLLTLDFVGLGIFKVAAAPRVNNEDKIATVTAEMYVENVKARFASGGTTGTVDAGK